MSLTRFLTAQTPVYETVLAELRAGQKRSHWMWFVFPQLDALGRSPTAKFYGIADLDEARAYLAHPVLGRRLLDCTGLVNAIAGKTAHAIFGTPDDLKFRSSVTLFRHAGGDQVFADALEEYYGGVEDKQTVEALASSH